jgi:hypothetical protein
MVKWKWMWEEEVRLHADFFFVDFGVEVLRYIGT